MVNERRKARKGPENVNGNYNGNGNGSGVVSVRGDRRGS